MGALRKVAPENIQNQSSDFFSKKIIIEIIEDSAEISNLNYRKRSVRKKIKTKISNSNSFAF